MKFLLLVICLWAVIYPGNSKPFSGVHFFGRGSVVVRQANGAPGGCVDATVETELTGGFNFKSVVNCIDATVEITMTAPTNGWVAVGFGSNRMRNADIYIGTVVGGALEMTDRFADNNFNYIDVPSEDSVQGGQSNIVGTPTFVQNGGSTTITFTRPIDTGDSLDFQFTNPGTPVDLIYAWGDTPTLFYHGFSNRGFGVAIDIFGGGAVNNFVADFRAAHGVLMIFAWIFVLVLTIYLARYMKDIGPMWFRIHQIANLLAVLISLAAWIEIIVSLGYYQARSHHILGTFVIAFSLAQPVLGFLADKMYDPNRTDLPVFPDLVHNWLGRLTMLCVIVTIYLGFCAYGVHPAVWAVFSVWLVLIIALEIVSEVVIGAVHHNGGEGNKDEAGAQAKLSKAKAIFTVLVIAGIIFWIALAGLIAGLRVDLVVCNY